MQVCEEWDQEAKYALCVECQKLFLTRASSRTLCRECAGRLEAEDDAERAADNQREES